MVHTVDFRLSARRDVAGGATVQFNVRGLRLKGRNTPAVWNAVLASQQKSPQGAKKASR
jgi:hypothetical protein